MLGPLFRFQCSASPLVDAGCCSGLQVLLLNVVSPGAVGVVFPSWTRWLSPPVLRDTLEVGDLLPRWGVYGLHGKAVLDPLRQIWLLLAASGIVMYGCMSLHLSQGWDTPHWGWRALFH